VVVEGSKERFGNRIEVDQGWDRQNAYQGEEKTLVLGEPVNHVERLFALGQSKLAHLL
jgi:hypothetical protein